MIITIDRKNITIHTVRDYEDLIEEYMGLDALTCFRMLLHECKSNEEETIGELSDRIVELEKELKKMRKKYTKLEEEYEVYKQEHGE